MRKSLVGQHAGGHAKAPTPTLNIVDAQLKSISEAGAALPSKVEGEPRSEKKRRRKQKRHNDINKGLDMLRSQIFIIDPSIKALAEARARASCAKGRATKGLLSRVAIMKLGAAILQRAHQGNEARKAIIAHLSGGHGQAFNLPLLPADDTPASPHSVASSGAVGLDVTGQTALLLPASRVERKGERLIGSTALASLGASGSSHQLHPMDEQAEEKAFTLLQEEAPFAIKAPEPDEPALKRLKRQGCQASLQPWRAE